MRPETVWLLIFF